MTTQWPYRSIDYLIGAYQALAPDWNNAPTWARWCAIDADGERIWHVDKPQLNEFQHVWLSGTGLRGEKFALPLGIDWRLCIWQRPEVTA